MVAVLHDDMWVAILAWLPLGSPSFRAAAASCRRFRVLLQAPEMRVERKRNGMATEAVIALAGSVCDWPDCCTYPQQRLHDLACHALVCEQWRPLPPLPSPVNRARAAAVVRGDLYVAGRWHGPREERLHAIAARPPPEPPLALFHFNMALQYWETVTDAESVLASDQVLREALLRHDEAYAPNPQCVWIGKQAFTVSSCGYDGPTKLLTYDLRHEKPSWSCVPLPEHANNARSGDVTIAKLGEKVCVIGGRSVRWDSPSAIVSYDPASGVWSPFGPLPERRSTQGYATADGMLSAVGHSQLGLVISGGGAAPIILKLDGSYANLPPIPRGTNHVSDGYYLSHPFNTQEDEPCGCYEDMYEHEGDYLSELEMNGEQHDGREFDADGTRLVETGEDKSPEEWAADVFKVGKMGDHILLSVEWA